MPLIPFAPFGELGEGGLKVFPLLSDFRSLTSVLWLCGLGSSILLTSGLRSLASGSAGDARKNWNDLPWLREQFAEKRLVAVESVKDYLRTLDAQQNQSACAIV
jgi:hypothetical protein